MSNAPKPPRRQASSQCCNMTRCNIIRTPAPTAPAISPRLPAPFQPANPAVRRSARPAASDGSLRLKPGSRKDGGHSHFRSEEHTSELQSRPHLVCRLLLEKKKKR